MKKGLFLVALTLCFLATDHLTTQAQADMGTAGGYMSAIGQEYKQINEDMMSYVSAAAHSKRAKKIEKKRKEVVGTMFQAIRKIKRMPGFEGDVTYRDAVLDYLNVRYSVMNEDYAKIVDMEEVAQESYDQMEAYLNLQAKIDEKIDAAHLELSEAQRKFAVENNINLVSSDSKLSEKMAKAGQVTNYGNKLFLIYFKCKIEEKHLREAIQTGDMSAMEQRKNALQTYVKEGYDKLREAGAFDGDNSLIVAVNDILRFYDAETQNDVPRFQRFYLIKDQFEQIKAALDAKKSSERTQADIDTYNKSVNDYNAAIKSFNKTITEANQKRGNVIDAYEKTRGKFRNKHTPRYR